MPGKIKQPELKVKVVADAVEVQSNLTKAINNAVKEINKKSNNDGLSKVKVQLDKEAFKAELDSAFKAAGIGALDGVGKKIGKEIADAINGSLKNIRVNVNGTSAGSVSSTRSSIALDRSKQIDSWAKQYVAQETKLYGILNQALNGVSKTSRESFNEFIKSFEEYENNLKDFSSRMTKKEQASFNSRLNAEYTRSDNAGIASVKNGIMGVWGDKSLTEILKSVVKLANNSSGKASFIPRGMTKLEYSPLDQSDIDVGIGGVAQKINDTVKAQTETAKVLAQNVQIESKAVSDSNKTADDHAELMRIAAEAEKNKAAQSQKTGDAIKQETQTIKSSNDALKKHKEILEDIDEEEKKADHVESMYDYTIAQGISANSNDVEKIAELATKQKEAGYELQAVSVDKAFDNDGITQLYGTLKYYNQELQTTVTQAYSAVKAQDAEAEGVYELNLAHERLVKTYKQERTENAALIQAQADAMKRQLKAQVEAAHQSMDAVTGDSLRDYFSDSFVVDTTDKLKELKRAISAAKSNLSALEQDAKSGDSFNALTNSYEKLERIPAQFEKLKTSLSRLKSDILWTIDPSGTGGTEKLHNLREEYESLLSTYREILDIRRKTERGEPVSLDPSQQITQIRDFLTNVRIYSGNLSTAKARENAQNALNPEKYQLMYANLQSNMEKAQQKFDKLVGTSPELEARLKKVKEIVEGINSYSSGSAYSMDQLVRALKQVSSLNSQLVAAKNSPANFMAQVYNDRDSWKTQAQKLSLDAGSIASNQFTSSALDAVSEVNVALGKVNAAVANYEALIKSGTSANIDAVKAVRDQVDEYNRLVKIAKERVSLAKQEDNNLRTASVNARDLQNLETAMMNYKDTNGQLFNNAGLSVMYNSIAKSIGDLRNSGSIDDVSIKQIRERISLLDSLTTELGYKGQTYSQRVKSKVNEISTYFVGISTISMGINQVRQMVTNIISLDDAMTELRKVTEETDATYEKFLTSAAERAKNLGSTMSDVVIATSTFARMGYTLEESEKLGDAALIAQNVWDNVGSVEETANSIISMMKAFGIEAENAISVVNKLNAVSNSYSVVSGDIANALADAGSALQAAGNSYDESIALFSSTNEIIQDWSKTATALRTIAARLRNTSGELQEMEIDADGAAESVTQLQQKIYAKSGVNIFESDNETFKSTIQILRELSDVWDTLSDVDQAEITRLVAGTRQQSVFAAIMNNFDSVDAVIETSMNSAGSAIEENERYLDSITGKLALLKSAYQSLSETLINSDGIKIALDTARGILEALEGIASISSGGALTSILGGVMTASGIAPVNFEGLFKGEKGWSLGQNSLLGVLIGNDKADANIIKSIGESLDEASKKGLSYADALDGIEGKLSLLSEKNQKVFTKNLFGVDSFEKGTEQIKAMSDALTQTGFASKMKSIGASILNIGANMALSFGIGAAIDLVISLGKHLIEMRDNAIQAGKEIAKQWKESAETLKETRKTIDNIADSYDEFEKLSDGVSEYGQNISLTDDQLERYHEISGQIAELFPTLISGYDDQGNAIVRLKNGVADLNAEYEKFAEYERAKTASGLGASLKGFNEEYFKSDLFEVTSSYNELEILRALRSGQSLDSVKAEYGKVGGKSSGVMRNIYQALKNAGYDGFDDYSSWNSVAEDYYITLEHQFEQAFNDQVIPGLVAYLQGTDAFKQIDTSFQNGIIQLLRNIDPDAIVGGSADAWRGIVDGITATLTDERSVEKFHKALVDMLSFDSSSGSHADYIRTINSLASVLPESLNSALSGFIIDSNNSSIDKTLKTYEKFGYELGLKLVEAISEADLDKVLNPDFEWDQNAADQSLDAFMAKFDEYTNAAAEAVRQKKDDAITNAIKSYNDVIGEANELFAVQSYDGILSDDVFDELKASGSGLADVLERIDDELTGEHGWKIADDEMEKFINSQRESADAVLKDNDAISEQYGLFDKYLGGSNNYIDQIAELAEENAKLGDAYGKVRDNEQYAYSEMLSLKEAFPDLSFEIDNATGKYNLMGDSVVALMRKNYDLIKSMTEERLELMKFAALSSFIEGGNFGNSQAEQNISAIAKHIESAGIGSLEEYEASIGRSVSKDYIADFVTRYTAALAEVRKGQEEIDALSEKAPAGELSDSKSSSKSETMFEQYKKQLDMEKNALEAEMKLDPKFVVYNLSTMKDYYNTLGKLAKNAYDAQELDAVEYQNYLIEVFNGLKEVSEKSYDDVLSKLESEKKKYDAGMIWDRSVFTDLADYYDQVEALNEKRFKQNLITTEEYVNELVSIFQGRNDMLEKTLSDYEHDITLWQNQDGVSSSGVPGTELKQIEQLRLMQDLVHKAADEYRETMSGTLSESELEHSDYIVKLQSDWWDYENRIKDIQSDMFDRTLSAYEDYISRRNSFASWGADTEIKAWGRVEKFLDESYQNGIITYKDYLEKKLDVTESMYNAEKQRQQDYVDAATRIMDKEIEALEKRKEAYEKQQSNYETTVSTVVDLINEQIDKLKEESDEMDKQVKLQKALKAVEDARSQRNKHIYREGQGFEWEADSKEIKNAQESLDELRREYDLDEQIKALEKYRDAWQATIDDYQKNIDKQIAAGILGADWEKQILAMRTDRMESFSKEYADISDQLSEDVAGSVASQIKELNELKDSWGDAIDEIEYQLGRYDELMAFEDEFKNAGLEQRKEMLADFTRSGVQNLQELIDKAAELGAALDALNGIETDYSRESSVINEMKKNAADWWESDEKRQKELADRNLELGTELGWYRDENGVWWKKKGLRAFADGGIADYTGSAMLHGTKSKPELILNNRDAGYLYSVLHGHGLMPDSNRNISGSGGVTITIGDINLSGVNSPESLANAIVERLPSRVLQRINKK